jgi:hypothetical protein
MHSRKMKLAIALLQVMSDYELWALRVQLELGTNDPALLERLDDMPPLVRVTWLIRESLRQGNGDLSLHQANAAAAEQLSYKQHIHEYPVR